MYNTRQKNIVYEILEHNKNKQLTIADIKKICDKKRDNTSLSTIYRILNNLDKNNLLIKTINQNKEAEYQLVKPSCDKHIHLKCQNCGMITHLDDEISNNLITNIKQKHSIDINLMLSTFIGLCAKCMKGK